MKIQYKPLKQQIWHSVEEQVYDSVENTLHYPVWNKTWDYLGYSIWNHFLSQIQIIKL